MHKANNLPPSCAVVTKSGSLSVLEPSGPVQPCNGTALPFYEELCIRPDLIALLILNLDCGSVIYTADSCIVSDDHFKPLDLQPRMCHLFVLCFPCDS